MGVRAGDAIVARLADGVVRGRVEGVELSPEGPVAGG